MSKPITAFSFFLLFMGLTACSHSDRTISPPPISPPPPLSVISPRPLQSSPQKKQPTARPAMAPRPPQEPPRPAQKKCPLAYHHLTQNGITLSLVSFDDREFNLSVADQAHGPATHWHNAQEAGKANRGVAAINGGFFTPAGKPLGLVITNGKRRGANNHSSLGSGIFLNSKNLHAILRREVYSSKKQSLGKIDHLLQAGPMLVDRGSTVPHLSRKNSRTRSFIIWDGNHHWAIGVASPCTLHELSQTLAKSSPAGFSIQTALNLDGGRSSDLWVSAQVKNGDLTHRGFFNKDVRNFLVLIPNH